MARDRVPDLPILLQSSASARTRRGARAVGAAFLLKGSATLLADLRRFMIENFGFGDFVFRLPDGTEVGRARDLKSLEEKLRDVPAESIAYPRRAQPLLELAQGAHRVRARPQAAAAQGRRDFASARGAARGSDRVDRRLPARAERACWSPTSTATTFEPASAFFARIGGGSLGGKARGLAFVRCLLDYHRVGAALRRRAHRGAAGGRARDRRASTGSSTRTTSATSRSTARDDEEIRARFLAAPLPGRRRARPRGASSRPCTGRSPCARRACSRTRSTSRSPASTRPTCSRTTAALASRAARRSSSARSSASTPRRSRSAPRRTCARRRTASRRRRWR